MWGSRVAAGGMGVCIVSDGSADAAKLTASTSAGIMPLVAAGALDGFRVVCDLTGMDYCS